jgi:nicotinamidase-related amidase
MPSDAALLVIDVQMFGFGEDAPVYAGESLVARIGDLIARAREAGVPVVYVQHCGAEGAIDEPGAPAWEIHPAIAPAVGDPVVQKRHPDAFQETTLQQELGSRGIRRLVVVGMQTEYCIDTTCRRAYSLGYDVTLVEDAHSTWDTRHLTAPQIIAHHNATLGGWFVTLKAASDVVFEESRDERQH